MTDRIDISDETAAICEKLGLDLSTVLEIWYRPDRLIATVALQNEAGHFYLVQGTNEGTEEIARELRHFRIRT